ncbi:hypothetical protein [Streptomyces sp. SJL17-4]|uniref:hypothetical protein n=1 Tax=Streptomyces sp. SJL17-4 TaxID=2967224 RepID=UPI0030CF03DA
MSRRIRALGVLAVAATLALMVPSSAHGTSGVLVIDGFGYIDPSGCYNTAETPATIINHTGDIAYVFSGRDCTGEIDADVHPGETAVSDSGESVWIN